MPSFPPSAAALETLPAAYNKCQSSEKAEEHCAKEEEEEEEGAEIVAVTPFSPG
jgi:hypothetical protein